MASKIADVEIQLRAQVATLQTDLNKAQRQIDKFATDARRGFANLGSGIQKAFAAFTSAPVVAGIAAIGTALGIASKRALEFASEIVDTAGNLGITTDALQELRFAASQAGVSVETLDGSLKFLNRSVGEAAGGNKRAVEAFRRLGVEFKDAQGNIRGTDAVLTDVLKRLGELESPAERTAIAMQLLGRSGNELGKLAREGADGIERLRREAHELGVVIDGETLAAAEKAGDKFEAFFEILKVRGIATILELTPLLDKLSTSLLEAAKATAKFFEEVGNADSPIAVAESNVRALDAALKDLKDSNVFGLNDEDIAALESRLQKAKVELAQLRFAAANQLPGVTTAAGTPRGSSVLLPPSADSDKAAAAMAREREQAERLLQQLREDRLRAEGKTIELLQERFRIEQQVIEQSALSDAEKKQALEDLGRTLDAEVRSAVEAQDKLDKLPKTADEATEAFERLKEFGIDGISDALATLATTGELTFKSLAESFIREFIQIAIKDGVAKLAEALAAVGTAFSAGSTGGSGWLAALGAVFLADGGIVRKPTFAMVGEAGPEAVIPLDRLSSVGGGGPLEVHVHDYVGAKVNVKQSRGPNGSRLDLEFVQAVNQAVATPKVGRTLHMNYGAERQGQRRG